MSEAATKAAEIIRKAGEVYGEWKGDGAWLAMERAYLDLITKALESPDKGQDTTNWQRIANERLRVLWIIAQASGGKMRVGKSAQEAYPGDDRAMVTTYTDQQFGDFVIEARVIADHPPGGAKP